jgi:hypothetical protein
MANLPVNPTTHDFLEEFFPDHVGHTICEIDLGIAIALILHCSCEEKLAILPPTLARYDLSILKVLKGVLQNVPQIPNYNVIPKRI